MYINILVSIPKSNKQQTNILIETNILYTSLLIKKIYILISYTYIIEFFQWFLK